MVNTKYGIVTPLAQKVWNYEMKNKWKHSEKVKSTIYDIMEKPPRDT